jgi:RNA polymerase sigma-70 factor, ECF subfamily
MEGWLTKIATNTCLNMLRAAKRQPELIVSELTENENEWLDEKLSTVANKQNRSAEKDLIAADLADRVLGVLSPEDRLALTMIDGDEASIKEVAELTGWSESKVKVRAFRARRRVREAMEKLLGGKKTQELHFKS